jgi:hypothetical protein
MRFASVSTKRFASVSTKQSRSRNLRETARNRAGVVALLVVFAALLGAGLFVNFVGGGRKATLSLSEIGLQSERPHSQGRVRDR